ncbi:snare region anchored in the vesicle membrane C-terminus-domain-containing protein [Rhodotorula diobovata]|uniref:Golgi SNAP receptor complex member 1 n=1 Tax=Rhodotorula diobovata TaxID=5288 RepID=A0A5C5FPU2_9BASI|nr:snare region anchored in the vesicle membrane C-terminus-domain-containing protein [Rhodotorula diobovata]
METLRRDLHASAAQCSSLLTRYSKLAQQASTSYSSSGLVKDDLARRSADLEQEITAAFDSFSNQVDRLANLHATAHPPPSASAAHSLERHREVLHEYRRDFQRTQASLRDAEQRANLLGSVREEISAFKTATGSSVTDSLLAERGRIDNSHRMADQTLEQAYATRAEFAAQRSGLSGIQARMNGVAAQVPGLNSVIGMINSRRRRDSVIMGTVLGICTLLLLFFVFG